MPAVPPKYIGAQTPEQEVKIRLGRFSRYYQDNPVHSGAEGEEPNGAGHQTWTGPQCTAHVGVKTGPHANPYYAQPWQALWIPTTAYVTIPNILDVQTDKKLEIGGIGTATIEVENILYGKQAGGSHIRERGAMSPLRGYAAPGNAFAPEQPKLLDELEKIVAENEWKGRFAYAAQITVRQGFGGLAETFTGLIEDIDSTSRPDRITITCRDFGQVFTDTHFFGWGKDPEIDTPVVFIDAIDASTAHDVGTEAAASSEAEGHPASNVLDFKESTDWQSEDQAEANDTQYVEIHLEEGVYSAVELSLLFGGMHAYVALKPTELTGAKPPTRQPEGEPAEKMTIGNKWLDKNGWVDITKAEGQIVPGAEGGNSYLFLHTWATGQQGAYLQEEGGQPVLYRVGKGSILRISFTNMHKLGVGKYRAGVKEFHGRHIITEEAVGKAQWIVTEDIADIVRVICQWAGFKEWDIPNTGVRLPKPLVYYQDSSWLDAIKQVCEGIGFTFFMADPTGFAGAHGEGSLGVPTFRKQRLLAVDSKAEQEEREAEIERNGSIHLPNRGSKRPGIPIPTILDRELLTAIKVKQSNEPLSYIIRTYGYTKTLPGDQAAGIASGKRVVYTFRPPWTGTPPTYADSRLGGVLKQLVHHDPLLSTVELCEGAALFIALLQAIESTEATLEVPFIGNLDLDDHAQLMDLGTGLTTRVAVLSRQTHFVDGEKRKFTMTLTCALLDAPDVRDMVNIINGVDEPNGAGGEWVNPKTGTGSTLGYG